jgi:hypothetical protein
MTSTTSGKFASPLLGAGLLLVASPIVISWFIHGDTERYLWIINGPVPFSSLGSGPIQLYLYAGLVAFGCILIVTALVARRRSLVRQRSAELSSSRTAPGLWFDQR